MARVGLWPARRRGAGVGPGVRGLPAGTPAWWTAFVMQPESAQKAPATRAPADRPAIDLAVEGRARDQAVDSALADVERLLDAWLQALEARTASLDETQRRVDESREAVEATERSLADARQQHDAAERQDDEHRDVQAQALDKRQVDLEEREARLDPRQAECDRRQTELDDRLAELNAQAHQQDERESRLAQRHAELEESIRAFEQRRATVEAGGTEGRPVPEVSAGPQRASPVAGGDGPDLAPTPAAASTPPDEAAVAPPESDATEWASETRAGEPVLSAEPAEAGRRAEEDTASQAAGAGTSAPAETVACEADAYEPEAEEAPSLGEPSATGEVASVDLDPETARKLRVLRRLARPGKTDAELLAQLATREPEKVQQDRTRKRWWKRGR